MKAEARALENPKTEPSEVKNMKKKIMKKLANLEEKCWDACRFVVQIKDKKPFKNNNLTHLVKRCGRLEALLETCFPSLPHRFTKVNNYKYL